ncbi:sulfotransferase [Phycicoccus sp. BSK3Z-2]|uniref:Sulfotransferase n=1 Tax=Phycicoccus avicenniae TaxID=2828860 RepID=A0A941D7T1_9MICO|nr:sulfotransferase [Phycicoccus avicenniae]MBR7743684.1 sulfotransferase [Phycicoccus avicenniae]
MEPDFLVVGAQRAGTTSLFRTLSEHPDIARPTASKGIGYFDLNHHRGRRWYLGHFPLRLGRAGQSTFESSGYYAFHPLAAARIAEDLPDVKVILVVRNPVDRAHSAHRHELARGFETLQFEEALEAEESRLDGEVERILEDPRYESFSHRHHAYLGRGRYAEQVERLVRELGRERVHVVDADRMFVDPEAELTGLFAWLGLAGWLPDGFRRENARPRAAMDVDLRARLERYFEPSDRALAAHLGRPPSWRADDRGDA